MAEYADSFTPPSVRPLALATRHAVNEAGVGVAVSVGRFAQPVKTIAGKSASVSLLKNVTVTRILQGFDDIFHALRVLLCGDQKCVWGVNNDDVFQTDNRD